MVKINFFDFDALSKSQQKLINSTKSFQNRSKRIVLASLATIFILALFTLTISFASIKSHRIKRLFISFSSEPELVCDSSHESYDLANNLTIKNYKRFSIAVDNAHCSFIGKSVLVQNGSAVDAAIAAGLCNGIMNAQSAGIGGGHFMVIYLRDKQKTYAINARETAASSSYEEMFINKSSIYGGLTTAIPGEIYGFWEAHKLAGRLPWKDLFQPTIEMCRNGFKISTALSNAIRYSEKYIRMNKDLTDLFINKNTNEIYKLNDVIKMTKLADTLELLSHGNLDTFYNSELTHKMIEEINENGGDVTYDDFKNYKAIVSEPIKVRLDDDYSLITSQLPSSGILVAFIMRVMNGFHFDNDILEDKYKMGLFYHRLTETFKHAFAQRAKLGDEPDDRDIQNLMQTLQDEEFITEIRSKINDYETYPSEYYTNVEFVEDHGTAHISVLADGDAVSFTSTINTYFGGMYSGKYTGIIYNNQMDDFSTPNKTNYFGLKPSVANFIKPNKRPMSSMSPIIIVDNNGDVKLVLGASGGSKILTGIAQVAIKTLWLKMNIKDAIDDRRIHHQIFPEFVQLENGFDLELQKMLRMFGHKLNCFDYGGSIVQGIHKNGDIYAYSDPRKGGIPDGH